jgi:hypothetical protein
VKRIWDMPSDVRTAHLCACSLEHAAQIGAALDEAGIVWWVKPPSAGVLSFLQREAQVFVDRTRLEEAAEVARRAVDRADDA